MAKCDKYESQGVCYLQKIAKSDKRYCHYACYLQEIAKLTTVLFLMFLPSTEDSKSIKCYCQCV